MANPNKANGVSKIILLLSLIINICFAGYLLIKKYQSSQHVVVVKPAYYLNRQTIFDILPITKNDIVFAGDSHTQFFEVHEFFPAYQIKNRGIFDDVSSGLLDRMKQVTSGQPKKIFIEIGFNDIGDISADSVNKNIKAIIEFIKHQSPSSLIYINSIFPSGRDIYKPLVPVFNNKIKNLCMQYHIPYIDVYAKLSTGGLLDKRYDCGDGVHLNGQGYLVWSACLKPYL